MSYHCLDAKSNRTACGTEHLCYKHSPASVSDKLSKHAHRYPRERDWYADDRNGNMYYFNICADANDVPESCQYLEKSVQAPVYQVSNESDCFWLGQLRSMEWELIDENEPAAVSRLSPNYSSFLHVAAAIIALQALSPSA